MSYHDDEQVISTRKLLGMYQRAIVGRWQMPQDTKEKIHKFCMTVLESPSESTRAKTGASKVLASLASVESSDFRSAIELTMKNDALESALPLVSDALANLLPPGEDESMIDDTPQGEQA